MFVFYTYIYIYIKKVQPAGMTCIKLVPLVPACPMHAYALDPTSGDASIELEPLNGTDY